MFISSFGSKPLIWVMVFFPSLLVPCIFFFISLFIAFTFSSILWPYKLILSAARLPVFWTVHLIGWLSLHRLFLFLELDLFFHFGPYFFVSVHLLCCNGQSFRYLPGPGNPLGCFVVLYVGEGSEREQCHLLGFQLASVTSPATHKQIGPFWCWFLGGWACVPYNLIDL